MEATPATLELVDLVEKEWGQLKMQRGPQDFKIQNILDERELTQNPEYQPEFLPTPEKHRLTVGISEEGRTVLEGLVQEGHYAPTEEQSMLVAFIRWYDRNRMKRRYMRLEFQD